MKVSSFLSFLRKSLQADPCFYVIAAGFCREGVDMRDLMSHSVHFF